MLVIKVNPIGRFFVVLSFVFANVSLLTAQSVYPSMIKKVPEISEGQLKQIKKIHGKSLLLRQNDYEKLKNAVIERNRKKQLELMINTDTIALGVVLENTYRAKEILEIDSVFSESQKIAFQKLLGQEIHTSSLANFDKYKRRQDGNRLCWAACIQMLLNYNGVDGSQAEIISLVHGSYLNQTANYSDFKQKLVGFHAAFDYPYQNQWLLDITTMDSIPGEMLVNMMGDRPIFLSTSTDMIIGGLKPRIAMIGVHHDHLCIINKVKYKMIAGHAMPTSLTYFDPLLNKEINIEWKNRRLVITDWFYCLAVNEKINSF